MPRWVARLLPIWPGPLMPLNTRAGSAEAPIEPGARTLCEPWRPGPVKVVALDRALEALALGDARDLDPLTGLEDRVDAQLVAHLGLTGVAAELAQVFEIADPGLSQVPELRLVELLLGHLTEADLHGVIAVALCPADPGDEAGTGLDHRHPLDSAVLRNEHLGHAHFSPE